MKVKMHEIIDAIPSMNKLITSDLSLKTAHKLSILVDKMNPHIRFFNTRREAMSDCNEEDIEAKARELLDMEVDIDSEIVDVSLNEDIKLRVADINALKPFVNFIDDKCVNSNNDGEQNN